MSAGSSPSFLVVNKNYLSICKFDLLSREQVVFCVLISSTDCGWGTPATPLIISFQRSRFLNITNNRWLSDADFDVPATE